MRSDDGVLGRPGMVMISPQMATTKPAPAESLTSRTGTTWPVGAPRRLGSVENEYCVLAMQTQYSFSTDPGLRGAPTGHVVPVREVRLAAGAGFVVAICGEIMTMPGLPRSPSSERIFLNERGEIEGLF